MVKVSISTSTFYNLDFQKTLKIIRSAGYDYIELTPYWKSHDWEIAQHLKNIKPIDVLKMVDDNGLKISSLHDCGGTVTEYNKSFIADTVYEYQNLTDDIKCVVLHTPHCKTDDKNWWGKYKKTALSNINSLNYKHICFENLDEVDGYIVPLIYPYDLKDFTEECNCNVNIDTTHYGEISYDIVKAAKILRDKTATVHLSNYGKNRKHLFYGEGEFDFDAFSNELDFNKLYAVTSECDIKHDSKKTDEIIDKTKKSRLFIEEIVKKNYLI